MSVSEILGRDGKAYTLAAPSGMKGTPRAELTAAAFKGPVCHTDASVTSRDDHLLTIRSDRLSRPRIEKGRRPEENPDPLIIFAVSPPGRRDHRSLAL